MIPHRPRLVPQPCGLPNIGATCYFNSFLQAMLSLTSVTQFFLENIPQLRGNPVAVAYTDLLRSIFMMGASQPGQPNQQGQLNQLNNSLTTQTLPHLFRAFVMAVRAKNPQSTFGTGQEDAAEALTLFLDAIDSPALYRLFMATYNLAVFCFDCRTMSPISPDNSCVVEMMPGDPVSEKLRHYMVPCPGYKCPKCGESNKASPPQTLYRLSNVGSIITILFRKYNVGNIGGVAHLGNIGSTADIANLYPQSIELPANGGGTHVFSLVAVIEHTGSPAGGHYWTRCLRRAEPAPLFARIDDASVSNSDPLPRIESYILFYHVVK
jgi:ubiquitin C-terminal hydrolase